MVGKRFHGYCTSLFSTKCTYPRPRRCKRVEENCQRSTMDIPQTCTRTTTSRAAATLARHKNGGSGSVCCSSDSCDGTYSNMALIPAVLVETDKNLCGVDCAFRIQLMGSMEAVGFRRSIVF